MAWQKGLVITVTGGAVAGVAYMLLFHLLGLGLPSFDRVKSNYENSQLKVFDRSGWPLTSPEIGKIQRLGWTSLTEVSPTFLQAVGLEDDPNLNLRVLRLLNGRDEKLFNHSSFLERFRYSIQSRALATNWSHTQIQEAYLNLAFYRIDVQGLGAASFAFFNKFPQELNAKESEALVAALKPSHSRMVKLRRLKGIKIPPLIADMAKTARGNSFQTTLDLHVQKYLQETLKRPLAKNQVAVVVMDNSSGQILGTVGDVSTKYLQAGGILTPFLYALALDRHVLTLASVLHDSPFTIPLDKNFHESVTAREALALGLKIPAVQVLELTGLDQFVDQLSQLGFHNLLNPKFYGSTLGLGQVDVRLLDVTDAYRVLANGGIYSPSRWLKNGEAVEGQRLFGEEAVYLVGQVLARHPTVNTEKVWTALRTAEIQNVGQWCVGFSRQFTVGVWLGEGSHDFATASNVWLQITKALHEKRAGPQPEVPLKVVKRRVFIPAIKKSEVEIFAAGTEPGRSGRVNELSSRTRIIFPIDQSNITFDPNMPKTNGRMFFQAHPPNPKLLWVLNGVTLGKVREFTSWPAQEGNYQLEIHDQNGQLVDQVRFVVKAREEVQSKSASRAHGL